MYIVTVLISQDSIKTIASQKIICHIAKESLRSNYTYISVYTEVVAIVYIAQINLC